MTCLMVSGPALSEVPEIQWQDLIGDMPPDVQADYDRLSDPDVIDWDNPEWVAEVEALIPKLYPVQPDLNGQTVRLPGYVVPLDFEIDRVGEFLLVPYHGACIHVPAPPPNQVVWVEAEEEYEIVGYFDPVWVTGEMVIEETVTDLAEAGYTFRATAVEPYVIEY